MQDIAMMANLMRYTVFLKIRKSSFGFKPRIVPATSAARKQPDPVQVSQLKSNFAFSAVGLVTTGCARNTALWRYGTSHPPVLNDGVVAFPIAALIGGRPQQSTKIDRIANGIQARATCLELWVTGVSVNGAACTFHLSPMVSRTRAS